MAQITGAAAEKVFQIQRWYGLNENPDGDTKLKMGEAADMRNFRITRDGNLQKRPGTMNTLELPDDIEAMWTGRIQGDEYVMAIAGGKLYSCLDEDGEWDVDEIGSVVSNDHPHTDHPHMFGFSDKLYILTGYDYMVFDGTSLEVVEGYVPLVAISIPPMVGDSPAGGELLEQVNKLTGKRRVWISPDGEGDTFQLPETGMASVDYVMNLATEEELVEEVDYTVDKSAGQVTFTTVPDKAVNSYEIGWTMDDDFRSQVTSMRFTETYNGTQDTRVFLYGDGSNRAIYSEVDYWGIASAEYFPDQNEVRIGIGNTPITGMIRHYSQLMAFKEDGAYAIQYGVVTLADTSVAAAFYTMPINRTIGNLAPGQVQLVLNSPITLFGSDVYEWRNNGSYASNLTVDERQAKRISDRIHASLSKMDLTSCVCYDDNYHQEYYISDRNGTVLVWNYAADAWYLYTDFPMQNPFNYHDELYFTVGPEIVHVSNKYPFDKHSADEGIAAIDCYWESGAMSFGQDYQRKYSAMLWLGIKPEGHASIDVTVMTDRNMTHAEKNISYALVDFEHIDFEDWTFDTNDKPRIYRLKIKAKKFVFYKLVLKSANDNRTATITSADMRVRFTGYAK